MAAAAFTSSCSSNFKIPSSSLPCSSEFKNSQAASLCSSRSAVQPSGQLSDTGCLARWHVNNVSCLHHPYHPTSSFFSRSSFGGCRSLESSLLNPLVARSPAARRKSVKVDARGGRGGRRPRRGSGEPSPNKPSDVDPLYANGLICPVPVDQQPVNEYRSLLDSFPFSWALLTTSGLLLRLGSVGICAVLLVGWPVAALEWDGGADPLRLAFGAGAGGLLASAAVALRLFLGWSYVENRLASATIEYEETGWYDGRVWVKPPPVLARDRLLQSYEVKPALQKLKLALFGLGAALVTTGVVLTELPVPSTTSSSTPVEDSPMPLSVRPYSEESARFYEPSAFDDDTEENPLGTAALMTRPMLPDFCF